ncbi:deoxyguanosinetriphosphate triphosphohydrolase [Dermacoccus abyssi]|uniref:Deoxyguanosinetriphosphate triphosphohydrolase n=1 Tax=Dermacoccus abyssi TaxID=322596 RepID=A0A417Z9B1_9MICO|nr:deoxyguanosinetriphosphate triphosphohydrolase [Dermacoccus abyssi]
MGHRPSQPARGPSLNVYTAADRERYVVEDLTRKRSDRDDFARDRARIVHSAALRRLSTKTQVWQAGTDDFVRNRLTHSLEVAQIGRELADALGCNSDVVDAACLAHDLGHPPFGHFGEQVLDALCDDIGGFEGNAQTFRLLTRLEAKRQTPKGRPAGLNLTRATLDASTKYPWRRGHGPEGSRKFGVYEDDRDVFDFVRDGEEGGTCLEAQIMDWADDVAYSVHDVEDAIAAEALDLKALDGTAERAAVVEVAARMYAPDLPAAVLDEALERVLRDDLPATYDGTRRDLAALKDMTSTLVGRFAAAPEDATRERYGSAPLVRYEARLVIPDDVRAQVAVLKGISAHFVMFTPMRVEQHTRQREVVEALVAHFAEHPDDMDPMFLDDIEHATSDAEALRVVVDQVASLTDARAVRLGVHSH